MTKHNEARAQSYAHQAHQPGVASGSKPQANTPLDYGLLAAQMESLCKAEPHWLCALSNASALLAQELVNINWVGFYVMDCSGDLVLGPFQGKPACVRLQPGHGVCSAAVASNAIQLVPNVHAFAGHIACDSATNSELVIPLHAPRGIVGVLDIDSPVPSRFSQEDAQGLQEVTHAIEKVVNFSGLPLRTFGKASQG